MSPVEKKPDLPQHFNEILSDSLTDSGDRSQTEVTEYARDRGNDLIQRIASLLLERDELPASLNNCDQQLSKLEQTLRL